MPKAPQPKIEIQKQFWDQHWKHAEERKVLNPWTERRAQIVLQTIRGLGIDRAKILDFGCGHGWFTERLADMGEAQGVDLSPEAIAIAKARRPDLKFVTGNVYELDLPKSYFDIVASLEVIAHVENQSRYIERAAQVLKPGGHFIITTGNRFIMDRLGDLGWHDYPPEHIENELSRGELKCLLRRQFTILDLRTIIPQGTQGFLRLVNSCRLAAMLSLFIAPEALTTVKERLGFGWQMIALAQKKA